MWCYADPIKSFWKLRWRLAKTLMIAIALVLSIAGLILTAVVTDDLDASINPFHASIAATAMSGIAIFLSALSSFG